MDLHKSLSYAKQNDAAQNLKKVFVREMRKIGTFSALYLDSHVFFLKKNYKKNNYLKKCKNFDQKKSSSRRKSA